MKFFPEKPLRLVTVRTHEKEGKKHTFVKLADEMSFESNEFMLTRDQAPDLLMAGTRYKVALDVEGRFSSVTLTPEANGKAS